MDGRLEGQSTRNGSLTSTVAPAQIGRGELLRTTANPFHGLIDELAIFDRALSAGEVQAIFSAGSAGKTTLVVIGNLVDQLIEDVQIVNLSTAISNSLDAKIDAAFDALVDVNNNNDVAAISALNAFINAVQAQSGKKIPVADANALIADAQAIIALLST